MTYSVLKHYFLIDVQFVKMVGHHHLTGIERVDRIRISDGAESQCHSDAAIESLNTRDAACYVHVLGEGALTLLVMWPLKLGYDCHRTGYMATELPHATHGTFNLKVTQILNVKWF